MSRILLFMLLLGLVLPIQAQDNIQWASKVVAFSSEGKSEKNAAAQALGQPDVSPGVGDHGHAWHAAEADSPNEWIELGFENPIRAHQLVVVEAENAGSVKAIYAYDENSRVHLLHEATPAPTSSKHHLLSVTFDMTDFKISSVKIVLDCSAVSGYNNIDAVGISASNVPINVMISINSHINPNVHVEKLGVNVNTSHNDHGPLLSPDGQILFFSRQLHPDNIGGMKDPEDIWFCRWDEVAADWGPAENIGAPLNTKGPNFVASVAEDDNGMVLLLGNAYSRSGRMLPGASIARLDEDSTWTVDETLFIREENNLSDRADYFMTPSMKVLVMSIQREDSYGDRDLYVSFPEEDGSWSIPQNLGPAVNSEKEERAPFLTDDEISLYFTSEGRDGYGGQDVFVSKRLDIDWQSWSIAENLGSGVNTEGDEAYFNFPQAGSDAYFARGLQGEHDDIFRFYRKELYLEEDAFVSKVIVVQGAIYDNINDVPVAVKLMVSTNGQELQELSTVSDGGDGSYQLTIPNGSTYTLVAVGEGFDAFERKLDLSNSQEDTIQMDRMLINPSNTDKSEVIVAVTVKGRVLTIGDNTPVAAKIILENREVTNGNQAPITSNLNGGYELNLPVGRSYQFKVVAAGHDPEIIKIDLTEATENQDIDKTIYLQRTTPDIPMADALVDIAFDTDGDNVSDMNQLMGTLDWLKRNEQNGLEIHGHTDDVGPENYNLDLSRRRAWSVYHFLVENGIDEERLTIKHFGESQPIVAEKTKEARARNRRVEFKVVENMMVAKVEKSEDILEPVYFDFDQSGLNDGALSRMEQMLSHLQSDAELKLEIHGHTDNLGPGSYNEKLAQRRAQSVYNYLIDNGIAEDRLAIRSFGENKPVAQNTSSDNRKLNRRVEFILSTDEAIDSIAETVTGNQ